MTNGNGGCTGVRKSSTERRYVKTTFELIPGITLHEPIGSNIEQRQIPEIEMFEVIHRQLLGAMPFKKRGREVS